MARGKRLSGLFLMLTLLSLVALLGGCGTTESMTSGYADKATIVVSAKEVYVNELVNIYVDGALLGREVKAVQERKATRKAARTEVSPGTHEVAVVDVHGNELYRSKIFVSAGKSKAIVLP